MTRYFSFSRSAYYGAVAALPLLAAYELLLTVTGGYRGYQIRNAADVWLRTLLESLGARPQQATLAMMLLLALAIPTVRRQSRRALPELRLETRYLALMLAESIAYSLVLGLLINLVLYFLLYSWLGVAGPARPLAAAMPYGQSMLQGIALALGAGLFEELAFRVVLLNVLLVLLRLLLAPWLAVTTAIAGAAFLFSLAHYTGSLADAFSLHSFLFRWLAGLMFTMLYYRRGFAITAYAHAFYDIWTLAAA